MNEHIRNNFAAIFRHKRRASQAGLLAALIMASGCDTVGIQRQRLVSQPNMLFSDEVVFSYQSKLLPQIEPGSAFTGGAANAGCTSCR